MRHLNHPGYYAPDSPGFVCLMVSLFVFHSLTLSLSLSLAL